VGGYVEILQQFHGFPSPEWVDFTSDLRHTLPWKEFAEGHGEEIDDHFKAPKSQQKHPEDGGAGFTKAGSEDLLESAFDTAPFLVEAEEQFEEWDEKYADDKEAKRIVVTNTTTKYDKARKKAPKKKAASRKRKAPAAAAAAAAEEEEEEEEAEEEEEVEVEEELPENSDNEE
jgi:hypothetical protein